MKASCNSWDFFLSFNNAMSRGEKCCSVTSVSSNVFVVLKDLSSPIRLDCQAKRHIPNPSNNDSFFSPFHSTTSAFIESRFIEATTNCWQKVLPAATPLKLLPWQYHVLVTHPDNRVLKPPICPLAHDPTQAVAWLLVKQASIHVDEELGIFLAEKISPYNLDIIIGLPTLGLTLAPTVAQRLGHARYVPMGYSKKFWYQDDLSTNHFSGTTREKSLPQSALAISY